MICDECETVAHCSKHGCIPKQPDYEGAIEVSVIFHKGQRMFAVPKQPAQQEPVFSFQMQLQPGWGSQYPTPCVIGDPDLRSLFGKVGDVVTFYTSPPAQRKPLTDEEIDAIDQSMCGEREFYVAFARGIEAAHDIKEKP